jgi:hypothetical protein
MIGTEFGDTVIESIAIGTLVKTLDHGLQPVRWIGCRHVGSAELRRNPKLAPIRISVGVLGNKTPATALVVSPQHRVFLRSKIAQKMFGPEEVLVASTYLLNVDGVSVASDMKRTNYYHMLFDHHEIVAANGAKTESLFTGPEAIKALGPDALEELCTLFPALCRSPNDVLPDPVRPLAMGSQRPRVGAAARQKSKRLRVNNALIECVLVRPSKAAVRQMRTSLCSPAFSIFRLRRGRATRQERQHGSA